MVMKGARTVHNGNGHGHGPGHGHGHGNGNGKRWLLIGLLILGGFWLVNDAYGDGYRDALVQTGQAANARFYRGGPDFPWGLLILGGIGYIAWRKGAFDRFGGPDGPFGGGPGVGGRGVQRYGDPAPGQGFGVGFRGPRALFEEWHRESHEAERARHAAPQTPQTSPPTPQASPTEASGNGTPQGGYAATPTPPPPPPAPDYWAAMARTGEATGRSGEPSAPVATPPGPAASGEQPRQPEVADGSPGATGPALERW